MQRSLLAVGILLATTTTAAADGADEGGRLQVVSLEGGIAFPDPGDQDVGEYEPVLAARISMAWEKAPVAMPATRGYAWQGGLTPEISIGGIDWVDRDRNEQRHAFIQGGLRLDLSFAQREMGLFRVSARGGMWLAGRAGVLDDDDHSRIGDLGVGWYLWLGESKYRVGFQLGALVLPGQDDGLRDPDDGRGDGRDLNALFYMGAFIGAAI